MTQSALASGGRAVQDHNLLECDMQPTHTPSLPEAGNLNDLGPLAWVFDELRKSLDGANKALKRFSHEVSEAKASDLSAADPTSLRVARSQLHQVVGALEMVGFYAAAKMVRGMEGAVQRFLGKPALCTEEAVAKVERAGFALIEYLEAVLNGKQVNPVAFFPQFRDVQELAAAQRIHPADLWEAPDRSPVFRIPADWSVTALVPGPDVRARFDRYVLHVIKNLHPIAARHMVATCGGLAAGSADGSLRTFWMAAAAYFEAVQLGLLPKDVFVKRAASRILLQYAAQAGGKADVSSALLHDLCFFAALVDQDAAADTTWLQAVRRGLGADSVSSLDYERPTLGLYDPALLSQARRRVNAAKEGWSLLAGGDVENTRQVSDQLSLVADSLRKILPAAEPLGLSLVHAVGVSVQSGKIPSPELGMEVATAILYLEALLQDMDGLDERLAERMSQMADRVESALAGRPSQPLEVWMETLYRKVSDRQTMGSVVGELKVSLSELERDLDQFSRDPSNKNVLSTVPQKLAQMRGVLSVLGLEQAATAVAHMRGNIETLLVDEVDAERAREAGTFSRLANNLSALSFLIDMLSYQPALARKLFVFDSALDELRPLMGRTAAGPVVVDLPDAQPPLDVQIEQVVHEATGAAQGAAAPGNWADLTVRLDGLAEQAALADNDAVASAAREASSVVSALESANALTPDTAPLSELAALVTPAPQPSAPPAADELVEDDLIDIFLEEARDVIQAGLASVQALSHQADSIGDQTTLRRAFHTLKGSSRMVGLSEFGEAAWAMEQVMNAWLAAAKPASPALCELCDEALQTLATWVDDIQGQMHSHWRAAAFAKASEAMRERGERLPLVAAAGGAETTSTSEKDVQLVPLEIPAPADALIPSADTGESVVLDEEADGFPAFADTQPATLDALPVEDQLVSVELDVDWNDIGSAGASVVETVEPVVPEADTPNASDLDLSIDLGGMLVLDDGGQGALDAPLAGDESLPAAETTALDPVQSGLLAEQPEPELGWDLELENDPVQVSELESLDPMVEVVEAAEPLEALDALQLTPDEVDLSQTIDAKPASVDEDHSIDQMASFADDVVAQVEPDEQPVELALPDLDAPTEDLAETAPLPETESPAIELDEDTKVIGSLRLGVKLFNVYLNEADEWSRRLSHVLSEWELEHMSTPVPDIASGLAHSLAGASAAVGFDALSNLARSLEHALDASYSHATLGAHFAEADEAALFVRAAEDIRRLLHQFAAGFLKEPATDLIPALEALVHRPQAPMAELLDEVAEDSLDPWPEQAVAPAAVAAASAEEDPWPVQSEIAVDAAGLTNVPLDEPVAVADEARLQETPRADRMDRVISVDDDIDAVDTLDADLFDIFDEEAQELLPRLGAALRQWMARPDNGSARAEVLRLLHTLKGSARLAGALRLGEMAHRMETQAERLGSAVSDPALIEPLMAAYDELVGRMDVLRLPETAAVANRVTTTPEAVTVEEGDGSAGDLPPEAIQSVDASLAGARLPMPVVQSGSSVAVRVRPELLDRLVNQTGEVMITRSRMEAELVQLRGSLNDLTDNLDRLRHQLRDIELQAESQMQSRLAQAKDTHQTFDPLEFDRFTRVQELTRMMAESVNDVATVQRNLQRAVDATEDGLAAQSRQTRELQKDLLRTRMVEFEGISDRLYRVVRQASKETGKQVRLDIEGGSIEMDRGVLDRMTPAFEHLLRNCVVHGIESAERRLAAGKTAEGHITIALSQEGNDVSVVFGDDGQGLDLPGIRAKAESIGLLEFGQDIEDPDIAQLIFSPGLSTASEITGLAGRGIGMDVVRSDVMGLGGRIDIQTVTGQGARFHMVLPLTTAVTQVVMLRAGEFSFGVPSGLVEIVRRVKQSELESAYASGVLSVGDESVPFYWSGALLQVSRHSDAQSARTYPVVIFRSAAQRVALHVDEVLGNQEVVVKNLGPQLSRLPGLAATTVLASGSVSLIYNPVALSSVYGQQVHAWLAQGEPAHVPGTAMDPALNEVVDTRAAAVGQPPLVLVVDDSITVRRVTQRLLVREGYRVVLAADGLQALEKLQGERPAVVLSDIEMPRMDGFDLVRNIRGDARLANLPVIMITSRIAEKHREHARQLGVDHYLGKPYAEDELLHWVREYCVQTADSVA